MLFCEECFEEEHQKKLKERACHGTCSCCEKSPTFSDVTYEGKKIRFNEFKILNSHFANCYYLNTTGLCACCHEYNFKKGINTSYLIKQYPCGCPFEQDKDPSNAFEIHKTHENVCPNKNKSLHEVRKLITKFIFQIEDKYNIKVDFCLYCKNKYCDCNFQNEISLNCSCKKTLILKDIYSHFKCHPLCLQRIWSKRLQFISHMSFLSNNKRIPLMKLLKNNNFICLDSNQSMISDYLLFIKQYYPQTKFFLAAKNYCKLFKSLKFEKLCIIDIRKYNISFYKSLLKEHKYLKILIVIYLSREDIVQKIYE